MPTSALLQIGKRTVFSWGGAAFAFRFFFVVVVVVVVEPVVVLAVFVGTFFVVTFASISGSVFGASES